MRLRPNLPSPSMAVAITALFVALGGTGYAATQLPGHGDAHVAKKKKKSAACLATATSLCANLKASVDSEILAFAAAHKRQLQGVQGPAGPQGAPGANGANGANGATGPSASYQDKQDSPIPINEPGAGVSTIDTLTLPGPASYLIQASGYVARAGLGSGAGASHQIQLRRDGTFLVGETVNAVQGSTGGATGTYSLTRLINVSGPSQTISVTGYDQTAAGTGSTAAGALTATLVGTATGAS